MTCEFARNNSWESAAIVPSVIYLYILIDEVPPPKSQADTPPRFLAEDAGEPQIVGGQITSIRTADDLTEGIWAVLSLPRVAI
jgi:hypothetical protein